MNKIICGDVLQVLRELESESVHCVVTSPPYWRLRDYGMAGQIGLEKTSEEYIAKIVSVFSEVRRVLRKDGTLWLNIGDTYNSSTAGSRDALRWPKQERNDHKIVKSTSKILKAKEMFVIPWRVALALQADGWYLRSDIIWHKPNPMPESVTDRPTKSHEYIFLLSKSKDYFYDSEAIKEPAVYSTKERQARAEDDHKSAPTSQRNGIRPKKVRSPAGWKTGPGAHGTIHQDGREKTVTDAVSETRNKRTVWTIATHPYSEAHFATFPEALVIPCILAGSPGGGLVLDPFSGAGTTAMVAKKLGRNYIGIELNPEYVAMSERRIERECGTLF